MRTIRHLMSASCVAAVLTLAMPALVTAQAKPNNATAQCKDGTYSSAKTKQGACSKHGGIQTWFADDKPSTTGAPKGGSPSAKETAPETTPKPTAKAAAKQSGEVPPNATAKCKDGTYSFAKQHSGACSHHGGVAEWYK